MKIDDLLAVNTQRILNLKDLHSGDRCFVCGTGPSLRNVNFDLLSNEIVFGTNKAYLAYDNFQYYGVSDPRIDYLATILSRRWLTFIAHGALDRFITEFKNKDIQNPPILLPLRGWMFDANHRFSYDLTQGTYNGYSVLIDVPLQVAYWMGFHEVYLLGCDWNYEDRRHFYDDAKGVLDPHFYEYTYPSFLVCREVYRNSGRKIINLTPESKLDIFPKMELEDVL